MTRPTDQVASGEKPDDSTEGNQFAGKPTFRKIPRIDPGFREETDSSVPCPRILGIKQPTNPRDRNNLMFLVIAVLVVVVIFGVLEYKQFHDTVREENHSAVGPMRDKVNP